MGVSTDGILFWGISFDPETDEDLPPWLDEGAYDVYDEWERRCSAFKDVQFGSHGSDGYSMWYVTIDGLSCTAPRGYPQDVTTVADEALGIGRNDEVYERLRTFVELNDLPWSEPKLLLSSYWG